MDLDQQIEDISARLDAHRDLLANLLISITYDRPDLELSVSACLMGTFVEGADQQQMAAYLDELRLLKNQTDPVFAERREARACRSEQ